jgi:hypothetical protein
MGMVARRTVCSPFIRMISPLSPQAMLPTLDMLKMETETWQLWPRR